jgi:NADPH:quinone reductase-like Zn-dependent oxidoreductase
VRAVYAAGADPAVPLSQLRVGDRPDPVPPPGWTTVEVRAATLNHHDLWTLRGVGIAKERFPMILGCDAAGIDLSTGREVVVHGVVSSPDWSGDETFDPGRSVLSELHQGTIAEYVMVPERNVVDKPPDISFCDGAAIGVTWLTAYRMLFRNSGLQPGNTVLVQGASGGVASACIALARAGGMRVWATARTEEKRAFALRVGAHEAFPTGARLPQRVDAVMETVGEPTWSHSLKSTRPGGRIVISGATAGDMPPAELKRVFFLQLQVIGSTMGTRQELADVLSFASATGLRPHIDRIVELDDAPDTFAAMEAGELLGKAVFIP